MITVKVKLLHHAARMPERKYDSDSGWDCFNCESVRIGPNAVAVVRLGFAVEAPPGYEIQLRPRSSSLLQRGLHVAFGTVDNGYRAEVCAAVYNTLEETQSLYLHERIAQMVIAPLPQVELVCVTELTESDRGAGGWGSTGQ